METFRVYVVLISLAVMISPLMIELMKIIIGYKKKPKEKEVNIFEHKNHTPTSYY